MEDLDYMIERAEDEIKYEKEDKYVIYPQVNFGDNTEYINKIENKLKQLLKLKEIAIENNLIASKSPYSESIYLHKENEKIDWHSKPENSYRLSDHWNFGDHCHTADKVEDGEFIIMIYKNGLYYNV